MPIPTYITLNNKTKMPVIGLGTWKSPPHRVGEAVKCAITEFGYRQIDCATVYGNEKEIGRTFKDIFAKTTIKRDDIFVTSKVWNNMHRRAKVSQACLKTLSDLQIDYLDLYLIHWGIAKGMVRLDNVPVRETWEAMEELVKEGLVKSVGVANFTGPMLVDLLTYAKIKPAMNQIELHPYNQQSRLVEFCLNHGIAVTAYSPLGTPGNIKTGNIANAATQPILIADKHIITIAHNHHKTPAQVLIRWAIQRGTVVIPKSVTPEKIKANIQVFDFKLTDTEMKTISGLDRQHRFVDPWDWWGIPYFD